ncbi:putative methyltransferase/helicase [Gentian ovary ringspot virus]|uniref:Putative methyltransferase/helicase n=1 Tax=Gentian ovary ringspot virus TaxID=1920772 RepID=A0A077JI55_9VIRU|nr:putative methyltransferase/helicase [Gentian ovary ringspot virus]BAP18642.1 putative methyltransferase/helicase [Gentian ovary ringspot virus]
MACLNEMMKNMLSSEAVINAVVTTAASNTRSPLHQEFSDYYATTIRGMTKTNQTKKTIDVRRTMSPTTLQELSNLYPEYNVVSSGTESGTHSVAAACRKLETQLLLDMLPKKQTFVWDIGGNWVTHMKKNLNDEPRIHCCCPILDARDAERKRTRFTNLERFARGLDKQTPEFKCDYEKVKMDNERIKRALKRGDLSVEAMHGETFCQNTFEKCVWDPKTKDGESGLRYAVAIHSIYDIKLKDLVTAMEKKGIQQTFCCFLFSPYMLLGEECSEGAVHDVSVGGPLLFTGGRYCVLKNKTKSMTHGLIGRDRVRFWFSDDPNMGYEHDYDSYLEYIRKGFVLSDDDTLFSLELMQIRGDTMFLKITDVSEYQATLTGTMNVNGLRCGRDICNGDLLSENINGFKCIPVPQNADCLMPVYRLNENSDTLDMKIVRIPNVLRKRIEEYLMRLNQGKMDLQSAKSMLASINNSIVFNGTHVRVVDSVEPSLLADIAVTVTAREIFKRKEEEELMQQLKLHSKKDIGICDVLGYFWKKKVWPKRGVYHKSLKWLSKLMGYNFGQDLFNIGDLPLFIPVESAVSAWYKSYQDEVEHMYNMDAEVEKYNAMSDDIRKVTEKIVQSVGVAGDDTDSTKSLDTTSDNATQLSGIESLTNSSSSSGIHIVEDYFKLGQEWKDTVDDISADEINDILMDLEEKLNPKRVFEDERIQMTYVDDSVTAERTPSRPALTGDYDYDAQCEYLWYLRSKIACDKSTMYKLICEYASGYFHSSKAAFPKNAFFMTCEGTVRYLFQKPQFNQVGHEYAVEFRVVDGKPTDVTQMKLSWNKNSESRITSVFPTNLREGYHYVISDLTMLKNEQKIFNNLMKFLDRSKFKKELKVKLIDGVPGCGKSTWILNNADLYNQVVLATARSSTDDLRTRFTLPVERGGKAVPERLASTQVRTVDSFFLNHSKTQKVSSFHFDEALMSHYGMIVFCAKLLNAELVICQGDTKQIPFINRVDQVVLTHYAFPKERLVIEEKRDSYRIPADVAYMLNKKRYYSGNEIRTYNNKVRSMTSKVIPTPSNLPLVPGIQYLTFLQSDKAVIQNMLRDAGIKSAVSTVREDAENIKKNKTGTSTVHEAQGETFRDVCLVRLMKTDNNIYPGGKDHQPYSIVGLTRHTRSLIYYTVVEDGLYRDISDIIDVEENQLRKCLVSEGTK